MEFALRERLDCALYGLKRAVCRTETQSLQVARQVFSNGPLPRDAREQHSRPTRDDSVRKASNAAAAEPRWQNSYEESQGGLCVVQDGRGGPKVPSTTSGRPSTLTPPA
jgi:hypothetical protein